MKKVLLRVLADLKGTRFKKPVWFERFEGRRKLIVFERPEDVLLEIDNLSQQEIEAVTLDLAELYWRKLPYLKPYRKLSRRCV